MFVELHAQSAFSFLEGADLPETLVTEAARLGIGALALVDRDGLYGGPRFHRAATAAGLTPIIGSEVTLEDGSRLPLLVEDRTGYRNLSRLLTRMKLAAPKGQAALALADLERLITLVRLFGRDGCFVEVQRNLDRDGERTLEQLVRLARAARVRLVATNQPLYAKPGG